VNYFGLFLYLCAQDLTGHIKQSGKLVLSSPAIHVIFIVLLAALTCQHSKFGDALQRSSVTIREAAGTVRTYLVECEVPSSRCLALSYMNRHVYLQHVLAYNNGDQQVPIGIYSISLPGTAMMLAISN
jgi:hypothetical protein